LQRYRRPADTAEYLVFSAGDQKQGQDVLIIAILVLALAAGCFVGAYIMFTTGIIKQA